MRPVSPHNRAVRSNGVLLDLQTDQQVIAHTVIIFKIIKYSLYLIYLHVHHIQEVKDREGEEGGQE